MSPEAIDKYFFSSATDVYAKRSYLNIFWRSGGHSGFYSTKLSLSEDLPMQDGRLLRFDVVIFKEGNAKLIDSVSTKERRAYGETR